MKTVDEILNDLKYWETSDLTINQTKLAIHALVESAVPELYGELEHKKDGCLCAICVRSRTISEVRSNLKKVFQ